MLKNFKYYEPVNYLLNLVLVLEIVLFNLGIMLPTNTI